ncbi:CD276 antigen homolog, partial [Anoplopoma fimbria]|uniref:CD276 antigen homolog n=1 Tax=Anoplopoma fimbria TaxID=229290 RepID=UPI0023EBF8FD
MDLMMKFLLTFLIILFPQTILVSSGSPLDLSAYTVDLTRVDNRHVVHCYRHGGDDRGPQAAQYRDRTSLNHEDLPRGVMTFWISSVNLSDSGAYKCFVPNLKAWCVVDLIVAEKEETKTAVSSTTGPAEEQETESDDR